MIPISLLTIAALASAISLGPFLSVAALGQVTQSWLIAGAGDKPNRDPFVVDERYISEKSDLVGFVQRATPRAANGLS